MVFRPLSNLAYLGIYLSSLHSFASVSRHFRAQLFDEFCYTETIKTFAVFSSKNHVGRRSVRRTSSFSYCFHTSQCSKSLHESWWFESSWCGLPYPNILVVSTFPYFNELLHLKIFSDCSKIVYFSQIQKYIWKKNMLSNFNQSSAYSAF